MQEEMLHAKESLLKLCRLMDSDKSGSLPFAECRSVFLFLATFGLYNPMTLHSTENDQGALLALLLLFSILLLFPLIVWLAVIS